MILLNLPVRGGGQSKPNKGLALLKNSSFSGFTLAEMMVVMLILSIVMAAFAPVMTRKSKVDMSSSSPWKWVEGTGDIKYAAQGTNQMAMIGRPERPEGSSGRLLLNADANNRDHLIFQNTGTTSAVMRMDEGLYLIGTENDHEDEGSHVIPSISIAIGPDVDVRHDGSIAIGSYTKAHNNSISIGRAAIGGRPLNEGKYGSNNIAIGDFALFATSNTMSDDTKNYNIAIGNGALKDDFAGNGNVAIGHEALTNDIGTGNTAIGYQVMHDSGKNLPNSSNNVTIGYQAGYAANAIKDAVIIGYQAGYSYVPDLANSPDTMTEGGEVIIGYKAGYKSSGILKHISIGYKAGYSGGVDVAIGNNAAADTNEGSSSSIAIGTGALYRCSGGHNTAIGSYSLSSHDNSGSNNVAIGSFTLVANTTGSGNVAAGYNVLNSNTTGGYNTALGYQSLFKNTTGSSNTAVGSRALQSNTIGVGNIGIGSDALSSNTSGEFNTAIGISALASNKSNYNTAVGSTTLINNTSGAGNSALGERALQASSTGSYNTAIGLHACSNVTGSNKTCLGAYSGPAEGTAEASSADNIVFLGTSSSVVKIPGQLQAASTAAYTSDKRLKNITGENTEGLAKIKQLKVYNFTFKKDPDKKAHVGVIAQDLQKVFPKAVIKGTDGYLKIRWDEMFYAMLNSIKELAARIDKTDETLKQVQNDMNTLRAENKQLKAQNKVLEARLNALEKRIK